MRSSACRIMFLGLLILSLLSACASQREGSAGNSPAPAQSGEAGLSTPEAGKNKELLIVPGKSAGTFKLGEDIGSLESRIGKGEIIPREDFQIFSFPSLQIDVCVQKDKIIMILVMNTKYHTGEGIRVGGSISPVMRAYGRKYEYEKIGGQDVDYIVQYWEKGISFSVKNEQIVKIKIYDQKLAIDIMKD